MRGGGIGGLILEGQDGQRQAGRGGAGLGCATSSPRGKEGGHQPDGTAPQGASTHASLQIVRLGGRHAGHTTVRPQVFKSNGPLG